MSYTVAERIGWIESEVRTPHNRLLLACLGPKGEEDAGSVVNRLAAREGVDWAAFVETAIRHGVAQTAAARLAESSAVVPAVVRACLQRLLEGNRARNRVLLTETANLVDALRGACVRSLVLKGAALAPTVYPDPALRNFADIDILVDGDRLGTAGRVLEACGFVPAREAIPWSLTREYVRLSEVDILTPTLAPEFIAGHEPHLMEPYRRRIVVEIHRGLARSLEGRARDMDLEPFWRLSRPFELIDGRMASTLGPEAMLVHLAIHAGEHALGRLMFPVDAALLLQQAWPAFSWEGALALAGCCDARESVRRLLELARMVCGAPVPDEMLTALQSVRGRRSRPARPRAILAARSAVGLEPLLRRVLWTGSLWQRLAAILRVIAEPVSAMREIYGVRSLPAVWLCYLVRPFHLSGRAVRILVRSALGARP